MAAMDYRRYFYSLFFIVLIIFAILFYRWFFYYRSHTRDAYVYANVVPISSLVSGHVWHIYVQENQHVKKGQKLFEIDPRPYEYQYHRARAELKQAMVTYDDAKKSVAIAEDQVTESRKTLADIHQHMTRYKQLYKKGAISELRWIDVLLQFKRQQAAVKLAENEVLIAKRKVNPYAIQTAEAEFDIAKYNLDHTMILAPFSGYITNFLLRKGAYVTRGQAKFALVETTVWWVIGRMRETILRRVRIGEKVKIHLDMYPDVEFHGVVESIGWGVNRREASTNAEKSSLPYLKLTEDWIRIAQRFPVRVRLIDLNAKYPLRIGASAHINVESK